MLDFFTIGVKQNGKNGKVVYPKFIVNPRTKDLMIRGGDFYAVWDENLGMWSKDEGTVIDIIDRELYNYTEKMHKDASDVVTIQFMSDSDSGSIDRWHKYCQKQMRDKFFALDEKIIFSNTKVKKEDYASKRLSYPLKEGSLDAYEELISTLYDPEEREKLEWAIGAIISGDSKHIQKFEVLYGSQGSGKGTILKIIDKLFGGLEGYCNAFNAKQLGMSNASFALESFKNNPLVSIQYDGDLSKIEDNANLNSIVSHEPIELNTKYTKIYTTRINAFLFMGTNRPVKITEAKSGIIRRLIDVHPSTRKLPYKKYHELMAKVDFELGAIAYHCLKVYEELGESYYEQYIPTEMISATNDFYDFIEHNYEDFVKNDYVTQADAWVRYKEYCEFAHCSQMRLQAMKNEIRNYFKEFHDRKMIDGKVYRSIYMGFIADKFESKHGKKVAEEGFEVPSWLIFDKEISLFDEIFADCIAQYAKEDGSPKNYWSKAKTKLKNLDSKKLHWVKVQEKFPNLIVMDFDIPGEDGKKDKESNIKAASLFPATYGEYSKSGEGIHLVYFYDGDVNELSSVYDDHIEIKVFIGDAALRRMLTKCNDIPIATISNLPKKDKGGKKILDWEGLKNEQMLRKMIVKNLNKEYHADTTSSVKYIKDLMDEAYNKGLAYDVSDMYELIFNFARSASNQKERCLKMVSQMHFKSDDAVIEEVREAKVPAEDEDHGEKRNVFFDIESYVNLFCIVWKYEDSDTCVRMLNPTPDEVAEFLKVHEGCLIGFNCRKYDNHMLYARAFRRYDNLQMFNYSQTIILKRTDFIGMAYDISKTDVYDFCTEKMGLKKWEIKLGIHHQEMGIPWDAPVPDDMVDKVLEYCENDVRATEAVFKARKGDFMARKIQVALVKLLHGDDIKVSVNDTTNTLSTKIIFGNNKAPQSEFNYRDMSKPVGSDMYEYYKKRFGEDYKFRVFGPKGLPLYRDYKPGEVLPDGYSILPFFPGYKFGFHPNSAFYCESITDEVGLGKSVYLDQQVGEGGRVFSLPGYYEWVWDGDISSMHPHSIIAEMLFGPRYTKIFADIVEARVAVKHRDFEKAGSLLGGALKPYLSEEYASDLAQALKIVINSIYGLTKAGFVNPFRDVKNEDNIVAKRGALFMTLLKQEVEKQGYVVCHIKTDSIKIPQSDYRIEQFVINFGREYGYEFETEAVFSKFCLLNDAAYVAKTADGEWITKAAQFNKDSSPYVYKTLFSHEPITFADMCETKSVVKGNLYLDYNEKLDDVSQYEKMLEKALKKEKKSDEDLDEIENLKRLIAEGHNYTFVGRVGLFTPVVKGADGGVLYRKDDNGKYYAAPGTTGYRWLESEHIEKYGLMDMIDKDYYRLQVDEAKNDICKMLEGHGIDLEWFLSDDVPVRKMLLYFMNMPEDDREEIPFEEVAT